MPPTPELLDGTVLQPQNKLLSPSTDKYDLDTIFRFTTFKRLIQSLNCGSFHDGPSRCSGILIMFLGELGDDRTAPYLIVPIWPSKH